MKNKNKISHLWETVVVLTIQSMIMFLLRNAFEVRLKTIKSGKEVPTWLWTFLWAWRAELFCRRKKWKIKNLRIVLVRHYSLHILIRQLSIFSVRFFRRNWDCRCFSTTQSVIMFFCFRDTLDVRFKTTKSASENAGENNCDCQRGFDQFCVCAEMLYRLEMSNN